MSYVKSFTVGNLTVNAAMASAVQQDELLSLLSATLLSRAVNAAQVGTTMGEKILIPMFMSMPQQLKKQVVGLMTQKVLIAGTETPVTVNDFGGKMVEWNTLLSQLILWNLEGFFYWLGDAVKSVSPPETDQAV